VLIQPSQWLRDAVLHALGDPPYRGPWMTFEHLFLFSTLCAATCLILWTAFARRGLMPPLRDWFRVRPLATWDGGSAHAEHCSSKKRWTKPLRGSRDHLPARGARLSAGPRS